MARNSSAIILSFARSTLPSLRCLHGTRIEHSLAHGPLPQLGLVRALLDRLLGRGIEHRVQIHRTALLPEVRCISIVGFVLPLVALPATITLINDKRLQTRNFGFVSLGWVHKTSWILVQVHGNRQIVAVGSGEHLVNFLLLHVLPDLIDNGQHVDPAATAR